MSRPNWNEHVNESTHKLLSRACPIKVYSLWVHIYLRAVSLLVHVISFSLKLLSIVGPRLGPRGLPNITIIACNSTPRRHRLPLGRRRLVFKSWLVRREPLFTHIPYNGCVSCSPAPPYGCCLRS